MRPWWWSGLKGRRRTLGAAWVGVTARGGLAGVVAAGLLLAGRLSLAAVPALPPELALDIARLEAAYRGVFPDVPLHELARGTAAIDPELARSQAAIEAFPPYEFAVEDGRVDFEQAFPDGAHFSDCFPGAPAAIRPAYPRFEVSAGGVVTLEQALNACRRRHGLADLAYGGPQLNALSAYLSFIARGRPLSAPLPDHPAAWAEYRRGRALFQARQGHLELACADCHVRAVGKRLRDVTLGPAIGVVGRFPIYSLRTGSLGSLQGRFQGCNAVVRLRPQAQQSADYRALEYFLNLLSRGYPVTGPGLLR